MTRPELPLAPAAAVLAALAGRVDDGTLPGRIGPVRLDVDGRSVLVWLVDLRPEHTRDGPCEVGWFDVEAAADVRFTIEVDTHSHVRSVHPDPLERQVARMAADALYGADSDEALERLVLAGRTWVALHDVIGQLTARPGPGMSALLPMLPGCGTEAALADGWDGTVADLVDAAGALEGRRA